MTRPKVKVYRPNDSDFFYSNIKSRYSKSRLMFVGLYFVAVRLELPTLFYKPRRP